MRYANRILRSHMGTKMNQQYFCLILLILSMISCAEQSQSTNIGEQSPITSPEREMTLKDFNVLGESIIGERSRTTNAEWTLVESGESAIGRTYITPRSIHDVVLDEDGIWLATNAGLLFWHLETGDLAQYVSPQTPLPDNYVSSLLMHDDSLYIATRTGVSIFDRKDNWQIFHNSIMNAEDSYGRPMAMVEDTLWVGSENGISRLLPNGNWETFDSELFPFSQVDKIETIPAGVYVEVHDGNWPNPQRVALTFEDGIWQNSEELRGDVFSAPDGSWWRTVKGDDPAAFSTHLLHSEDEGVSWTELLSSEDWLNVQLVDESGKAYIARDSDLLILNNEVVDVYRFTDIGPELNFINHIVADKENRIWIATDGRGLSMFDGNRWHNWQTEFRQDMREDAIRGLAVSDSKIYAGAFGSAASGGVMVYDIEHDSWKNYWPISSGACPDNDGSKEDAGFDWEQENPQACATTIIGNLSGGGVGGITVDEAGRVYLATAVGILDVIENDQWFHYTISSDNASTVNLSVATYDVLIEPSGRIIVASDAGIHAFDGQTWQELLADDEIGSIRSLLLDNIGDLWAASNGGLVHIENNSKITIYNHENSPLTDTWIRDIAISQEGTIWGVSNSLLFIFDNDNWETFKPEDFGISMWGDTISIDGEGQVWIESGDGLLVLSTSFLREQ